jgi:hypothetical protein
MTRGSVMKATTRSSPLQRQTRGSTSNTRRIKWAQRRRSAAFRAGRRVGSSTGFSGAWLCVLVLQTFASYGNPQGIPSDRSARPAKSVSTSVDVRLPYSCRLNTLCSHIRLHLCGERFLWLAAKSLALRHALSKVWGAWPRTSGRSSG